MRKMKDSGIEWLGEIPENWEICKLKNISSIVTGNTPSKTSGEEYYSDTGLMWVKPDNLKGTTNISSTNEYLTPIGAEAARIVPPYTPLVCCIGSVGKIGVSSQSVSFNQQINAVDFNEKIDRRFGLYFLISQEEQHKVRANGNVLPILNAEQQGMIPFVFPPHNEQLAISSYLDEKCDEIDALIASKEKTNELLKERRQSIIYEAVTKGLNSDAPMKDSGIEWIGQIPEHWKTTRLRSKFSFGKGLPITKADLTESGIGVISYGQIHSKSNVGTTIKPELVRYVDSRYLDTNESSMVYNGDFIFADTSEDLSGCGNCVYVDVDYPLFAGYHTMILRPESDSSSKYYSYLFATDAWRSQIRAQATGVKLFSITQKMLRDTLLIEPTEEEKEGIVAFLDEKCSLTDAIIADNETTIEKLKEYRQSIIYEAVTGKIEI